MLKKIGGEHTRTARTQHAHSMHSTHTACTARTQHTHTQANMQNSRRTCWACSSACCCSSLTRMLRSAAAHSGKKAAVIRRNFSSFYANILISPSCIYLADRLSDQNSLLTALGSAKKADMKEHYCKRVRN